MADTALNVAAIPDGATVDALAGGRVEMVQPADGRHRCGLEAMLLGAAVDQRDNGAVVDLGAGSGAAGLLIAARCPGCKVYLVDCDANALAHAAAALRREANAGFSARVSIVEADVSACETARMAAGLPRDFAGTVVANPPFFDRQSASVSPNPDRALAHVLGGAGLEPWVRCAASVLKHGGELIVIIAADLLAPLLTSLGPRFGGVEVLPIHPRAEAPAHRILVRAIKESGAPLSFLPSLVLHGEAGSTYLPEIDAMLRGKAALRDVHSGWGR